MLLLLHLLTLAAIAGHLAICITSYNRFHSLPFHFRLIKLIDVPHIIAAIAWPGWIVWQFLSEPTKLSDPGGFWVDRPWGATYAMVCIGYAVWIASIWLKRFHAIPHAGALISNDTVTVDVARKLGFRPARKVITRICSLIPGNEIFRLSIHAKTVKSPALPAALDRLTISHLSDFHFCGKIGPEFFKYVVERTNELESDLIAITGDILEKQSCYEWLSDTLGRLKARHGIYFVLGNHDKRLKDVGRLRRVLTELGMIDVGGGHHCLTIRGSEVLISGNEMPWFGPAASPPPAERSAGSFRILLSHSPDQLPWAKQHAFDLVLAGHTHGGQIRLPFIGPIVCPSRFGVKYASGVYVEDNTLMHVSRGISGVDALRINCPPELTQLILRSRG